MFLHADSEGSGQTGRMPRLISLRWVQRSFCWFCHEAAHMYSYYSKSINLHRNDPKFSGRYAWANSADQIRLFLEEQSDQVYLFAIPSASFGLITL